MHVIDNIHAFIWQSMTANNCNSYLIDGPTRVLIDPGHRAMFGHVESGLKELGLGVDDIDLIICTHAHQDHLEALQLFKEKRALFTLHETEWQWIDTIGKQMSAAFGIDMDSIRPDFFLQQGDLSLDDLELKVFHTPGHSPGSVSLYWPDQKALFTGDLIFKDGLGRTDLPGGDGSKLKASIKRLAELDVEWLLSGHGDIISGSKEVKANFEVIEQFWFAYI
ncbi:MAG: MBL fold metallo-hydrolase [Desulfobacterales bacterium]|nr:MAG: MBL fold metallo-hydrolase [Desulfobacterales bacterium]